MFTYVQLKNFKSFKNVEIDLQSKKNVPKTLAIIYGVNGSGKTTVAQAFYFLRRTMQTMQTLQFDNMLNEFLDEKNNPPEEIQLKTEMIFKYLTTKLSRNGLEKLIEEYKMIDSAENLSLEYHFEIDGGNGSYYIEMDENSIVKERLEYKIGKKRGCYFNIEDDEIWVNEKIFESKEFYDHIYRQARMYWGRHTLLSILYFEMGDKSDTYINSNISMNLMKIMMAFEKINYKIPRVSEGERLLLDEHNEILGNLEGGTIEKRNEGMLDKVEKLIDRFFVSLFNDVVGAYYKRTYTKGNIEYALVLRKKIEVYEYDIDFKLESNGTKEILEVLPYLVAAVSGSCVIIDEYGIGVHDLLAAKLLESIAPQVKGQLIITTHNTMLMNSDSEDVKIEPESLYFILNNKTFRKTVCCITEIEGRLHPNYNYQKRYFTHERYRYYLPEIRKNIDLKELAELYQ